MKFMGLLVLACVAVSMAAEYQYQQQQQHQQHQQAYRKESHQFSADQKDVKAYGYEFSEVFQRFYVFFKEMFTAFYQAFYQNFGQYVPANLANAVQKVFTYWPNYEQVFTPEFYKYFAEFTRAVKNFFMPHHFTQFVDQAFQAFPTVTEFLPAGFLPAVAECLQHFPVVREFLNQFFVFMQQLLPHFRQN